MKCPFCQHLDTQVKDSRPTEDNAAIRRRRICPNCAARFTTFERIQIRELTIIKRNGERQPFNREKIVGSMRIALQKRNVSAEKIETIVNSMVRRLESMGEAEIHSKSIGEMVMDALRKMDMIGYVRFASVYKDFHEIGDFETFITEEVLS